ncbi:DHA2 family efflux MFS transporter permease subunit [Jatrophihabitans sp. YIM 134969]
MITPRRAAATAYVTSLLLAALDTHVVNIMLPTLTRDFDASLESVKWAVLGYVLALAIAMPVAPWLSARFGERRVFVHATVWFVVASAACGLAQTLSELVAVRAVQGAAGGLVGPIATAMLYRTYPQGERARMTRLLLMPIALGPAIAPPLGGLLVDHLSWRAAFFLNAPIGLATAAVVLFGLERDGPGVRERLNVVAFLAAAIGLSGVLYALGEAPNSGWADPRTVVVTAVAVAALATFVGLELRARTPLLDLRMFAEPVFRASSVATGFQTLAFLGGMYYVVPLLLQEVTGRTPFEAGLVLAAVPVGVVLSTQTVGRGYDLLGPRTMVVIGQASLAGALVTTSRLADHSPMWVFVLLMFLAGFSNGMAMVSLQTTIFSRTAPRALTRGATLLNVNRQVATAVGVGVATAVITSGAGAAATGGGPYRTALLIAAGFSACAALAGLALPGRSAAVALTRSDAVITPPHEELSTAPG